MHKQNVFVGIISIVLGITVLYLSQHMSLIDEYGVPGERFWPYGLAWLFIGLGGLQCISVLLEYRKVSKTMADLSSPAVRSAYSVAVVMVLYASIMMFVGFLVGTLLLIPTMMWMMGERRVVHFIGISAAIVVFIYVFFTLIFNSPLPAPVFLE